MTLFRDFLGIGILMALVVILAACQQPGPTPDIAAQVAQGIAATQTAQAGATPVPSTLTIASSEEVEVPAADEENETPAADRHTEAANRHTRT